MNEILLTPESAEQITEHLEQSSELEVLSEKYMDGLSKALDTGDIATSRYYLGKLSELYGTGESGEGEEDTADQEDSAQTEQVGSQSEVSLGSSERADLERKLRDAKSSFQHSSRQLKVLLNDKAHGFKGVDSGISDRKYQIKVYSKEIRDLERALANLKD